MRLSRKARVNYAADFETTTDPEDCRVWLWGIANLDDPNKVDHNIDIDSFLEYISNRNSNCYFHNLKFDGHFIIDRLLKLGYAHVVNETYAEPMTFKTLISDMGSFYSITVRWSNGFTTEFRDSAKKLPMTVKRVATSFKLDTVKGELDYHTFRPVGHQPTEDELAYLYSDVKIVAKAMRQILDQGMQRLTVASDSMAEYKRLIGSKEFKLLFPQLRYKMDAEIRRAYRGGFTYADPRHQGKQTRSGLVLDVNSLYPAVMYNMPLPFGEPEFFKVVPDESLNMPLSIFSVTFTAKLKPGHIPCIQIKNSFRFSPTQYLTEINEPTTLMMTDVDFRLYQDHYDMDILEHGGGWQFTAANGLFDEYIEKWSRIKEHSEGGIREIAKLHLNSLYGKFASNPNVVSKNPYLTDDGRVKFKVGDAEIRPPVYTPVGVFITSYARDICIRAAQVNYDSFAYADTDSLHLLTDKIPETLEIHPTKMGAWKFEYNFDTAFYIRSKAYLERHAETCPCKECAGKTEDVFTNRLAGVPEHLSAALRFDDLYDGKMIEGKLVPKSVPGGVVLKDVPYELKL